VLNPLPRIPVAQTCRRRSGDRHVVHAGGRRRTDCAAPSRPGHTDRGRGSWLPGSVWLSGPWWPRARPRCRRISRMFPSCARRGGAGCLPPEGGYRRESTARVQDAEGAATGPASDSGGIITSGGHGRLKQDTQVSCRHGGRPLSHRKNTPRALCLPAPVAHPCVPGATRALTIADATCSFLAVLSWSADGTVGAAAIVIVTAGPPPGRCLCASERRVSSRLRDVGRDGAAGTAEVWRRSRGWTCSHSPERQGWFRFGSGCPSLCGRCGVLRAGPGGCRGTEYGL
jgi:hypothetical protein